MIAVDVHRPCADCGKVLGPSQYDGGSASCWACVIKAAPRNLCPVCGIAFRPKQANSRACSSQCHQRLRKQEVATKRRIGRRCLTCNTPIALLAPTNQRYCSDRCRWKAKNDKQMQGKQKREAVCALPGCNVPFQTYHQNRQYCCEAHRVKGKNAKRYQGLWGHLPPSVAPKPEPEPDTDKHGNIKTGSLSDPKFFRSGYTESKPRIATTTVTGCPTCRASGKDYRGNIHHASWCKESASA